MLSMYASVGTFHFCEKNVAALRMSEVFSNFVIGYFVIFFFLIFRDSYLKFYSMTDNHNSAVINCFEVNFVRDIVFYGI